MKFVKVLYNFDIEASVSGGRFHTNYGHVRDGNIYKDAYTGLIYKLHSPQYDSNSLDDGHVLKYGDGSFFYKDGVFIKKFFITIDEELIQYTTITYHSIIANIEEHNLINGPAYQIHRGTILRIEYDGPEELVSLWHLTFENNY